MIQFQLNDRALDFCKALSTEDVVSSDVAFNIVKAVHKRESLAMKAEIKGEFISLLNTKREGHESFKNSKSQFEAQVKNFDTHSSTTKLPKCFLLFFMLLGNSNLENN